MTKTGRYARKVWRYRRTEEFANLSRIYGLNKHKPGETIRDVARLLKRRPRQMNPKTGSMYPKYLKRMLLKRARIERMLERGEWLALRTEGVRVQHIRTTEATPITKLTTTA